MQRARDKHSSTSPRLSFINHVIFCHYQYGPVYLSCEHTRTQAASKVEGSHPSGQTFENASRVEVSLIERAFTAAVRLAICVVSCTRR